MTRRVRVGRKGRGAQLIWDSIPVLDELNKISAEH